MSRPRRDRRRGSVLLVVFVLVMVMSLAAYSYMLSMQTEHLAAKAHGDQLIMQQAAWSGVDLLASVAQQPRSQRETWGGLVDNATLFGGLPLRPSERQSDDADWGPRFVMLAAGDASLASKETRFGVTNESAKLHLGKLVEWDTSQPGSGRLALMQLPGMDEGTADAILDWIDPDDTPRDLGMEQSSQTSPVAPRNGLPWEMEELLYIRGVTSRRLMGFGDSLLPSDTEATPGARPMRSVPSPQRAAGISNSSPALGAEEMRPWIEFLTVYSAERNESRSGTPRVFVNRTRIGELHAELIQSMPAEWANYIVLYRQYGPGIGSGTPVTAENMTIDINRPAEHEIKSLLDLMDVTVAVPDGESTQLVSSPFSAQSTSADSPVVQLIDQATVTPDPRLMGRVNVQLAPREVLLGVPGLTPDLVERIMAARAVGGQGMEGRNHDLWMLSEGLVDRDKMRELLPNVTCGGDVYRASCWGLLDPRTAPWGCEIVWDASDSAARQVYYQELPASQFVPPQQVSWTDRPTRTGRTPSGP